jgi:hypothetical protein
LSKEKKKKKELENDRSQCYFKAILGSIVIYRSHTSYVRVLWGHVNCIVCATCAQTNLMLTFHSLASLFFFFFFGMPGSWMDLLFCFNENSFYHSLASLTNAGRWQSNEPPSLYIFINCSTRELGTIEKYVVCHLSF